MNEYMRYYKDTEQTEQNIRLHTLRLEQVKLSNKIRECNTLVRHYQTLATLYRHRIDNEF